jgi:hypothetical protein
MGLQESDKQKNFFVGVLMVEDENIRIRIRIHWSEARVRIRTKMSQIHNIYFLLL